MRKLTSIIIVGVMMLTLILGLFGGVVEEGKSDVTYDSLTNTILLTGVNNLEIILADPDTDGVFWYNITTFSYITEANIQISTGASLSIDAGETLKFNGTVNMTVIGTLNVNGLEGNMALFTSNSTIPSAGDWEGLIFNTTIASNSNINYLNISYATIGIYCDGSSPTITNSIVTKCLDNGIKCNLASPTINNVEISDNGNGGGDNAGLLVISSSPLIENSTFENNPNKDIYIQSNSHPISLNSSFNSGKIFFNDAISNITIKWYLHVLVKDNITDDPIQGASVWVRDIYGDTVEGSPFTTDPDGYVNWIQVVGYVRDNLESTPHTPHNITVTHDEYYSGYVKPTISSSMLVQINLTMIRRDLTTTPADITFLPGGIPIAGENLTVYVIIYNVEVDDAKDVRVKIFDNTSEGEDELYHIIIPEVKGDNSEEISKRWKPTPGIHRIDVAIDPYNEIKEINSTMPPGWAENNNNASNNISVNARPEVNITEPDEGAEINGTVFINGTAFDDPRDDEMIPFPNDISRVDIRINDYDWIELIPIYNITSGNYNWFYEWDTTQWNGTPLSDGNYTIYARAWDNYHYSFLDEVNITVNNTGANSPPNAVINEPLNFSLYNVGDLITFNGSESNDNQTAHEDLNFSWDFDDTVDSDGDGDFTNDEDAYGNITTFAYDKKGFFDVTLTVTDEGGLNDTAWITVEIFNYRPVPVINASDTEPFENDTVTFNATESYDPDGLDELLEYFWDFDDGTFWTGIGDAFAVVNHAFNESRIFNVTLTLTDQNGTSNSTWIHINVRANAQPVALIDEPTEFNDPFSVNETIIFNATSSFDENDEDLEYFWDFGDGTNSSWITEPITMHYYSDVGTGIYPFLYYTITLQVRDNEGSSDTDTVTINVNNYPPVASATSNVTTAQTNEYITFDGSDSYDPEDIPLTYLWDFDDGNTSTDETVEYEYAQDGEYNVTLTVTDSADENDTDWIIITIINRAPIIENVTYTPESPRVDEVVYINITASDEDGQILRYTWVFGDGSSYFENETYFPDHAFDGNTNHSYTSKDTYTVTITVQDDDGDTNSTQIEITIRNTLPEVEITSPSEGEQVRTLVRIEGTASDPDPGDTISEVYVKIDNGDWVLAIDTTSWYHDWDSTTVYNGQHTIYAMSYDGFNYSEVANVTVDVDNHASDIILSVNLNQSSVVAGGSVEVYGNVIYDNGEDVYNAVVNVTIQNEPGYWANTTEYDGSYSIEIIAPISPGTYTVKVTAIKDTYSDQEQKNLQVTAVPAKPDLFISSSDISFNPSAPVIGDTVQIEVTVRNIGDADAYNVLVNAYDDDPAAGGDPIQPQGSDTVTVQANDDNTVTLSWDTTGLSGRFNIYVILDPNNQIEEEDEQNNKDYRVIDVQGQPDFAIDSGDITFSKSNPKVDETIDIRLNIQNEGSASADVSYKVYDGDPETGGAMIGSGQETISANGDETVTVSWTPEEGGEHEIFVVLESEDDPEEDNNKASKTITVEALPGEEGIPAWLIPFIVILVIGVVVILFLLYRRGKGAKPEEELPVAQVVKKEEKAKPVEKEKEEEKDTLIESHGGIRIG